MDPEDGEESYLDATPERRKELFDKMFNIDKTPKEEDVIEQEFDLGGEG